MTLTISIDDVAGTEIINAVCVRTGWTAESLIKQPDWMKAQLITLVQNYCTSVLMSPAMSTQRAVQLDKARNLIVAS